MSHTEITALEHASRTAMAWSPEGYDGQTHVSALFTSVIPALFILGVVASMLVILM
jgi:hypothetical protein